MNTTYKYNSKYNNSLSRRLYFNATSNLLFNYYIILIVAHINYNICVATVHL